MVANNLIFYSTKIIIDIGKDIAFFPFWWYSKGFLKVVFWLKDFLLNKQKKMALLIWVKNIFTPMYDQHDWQGVIISFFVRLFQIIFRSLLMFFWLLFSLVIILFWLIIPILVIYQILFQIGFFDLIFFLKNI